MADECEPPCASTSASDTNACNFICGVVEGFYGRPWTTDQRKDLFQKMKRWGMDSYVYAPKDDYKHRAYWRELYTVEEAEHLTGLINAAKSQGIIFYYALSPGLDITYSNQKEIATLKRKLEQVSQFGCTAFSLLFDDIESEMSEADKEIFQSFAHAQVSITNEVQQYLGGSTVKFLLCPTQYCGSRAMPTVSSSEYLGTLGAKLAKDIDIMWTGPKVISKTLTADCIEEITRVLRRPPVIWDNLHANDYDQKRMFLGPYTGRSPELIPLLRGVLSNPNCEYNANAVPIRTLAHWANCSIDATTNIESVAGDIKLEQEGGTEGDDEGPLTLGKHVYHHRQALRNAVMEWLPEFSIKKTASGPISKPQPVVNVSAIPILPILPMVNTCMSLTTTSTTTSQGQSSVPTLNTAHLQALADICTTVSTSENFIPTSNPIMNSLVSPTKVVTNDSIPNPIVPLVVSNFTLPSEIPVSTIPIPIMEMKNWGNAAKSSSVEAEMIEVGTESEANSVISTVTNVTVMSNTQSEVCTVSECLDVRVSHVEESQKGGIREEKEINIQDEESVGESALLDDSDERLSNKEVHNGAMSIGESPLTLSPPHGTESAMECTLENEVALNSIDKLDVNHSTAENKEDLDTGTTTPSQDIDVVMLDNEENSQMQIEVNSLTDGDMIVESTSFCESDLQDKLTLDDLMLLCDLFYLPFEHGSQGIKLLNEFNWLKSNATYLLSTNSKDVNNKGCNKSESQEWHLRAKKFAALNNRVVKLSHRLGKCSNQELAHDLCGYVWDIRIVVGLLNSFVQWLALGKFPPNICNFTQGSYTWFSKGWKEAFMSGDQEPWVFRGGLTADLQRLLPIDNGNDLLSYKPPPAPDSALYTIRPFTENDKEQLRAICRRTCIDGMDCSDLVPPELPSLPEDRLLEPFVSLYPELCMVMVEEEGSADKRLMGYACAVPDLKVFQRKIENELAKTFKDKYPLELLDKPHLSQIAKEWVNYYHNTESHTSVPEVILHHHPATMSIAISPHSSDGSASKRLVTCLLAALRANGLFGVHVCIQNTDHYLHQFYVKLGFLELSQNTTDSKIYLGRNF